MTFVVASEYQPEAQRLYDAIAPTLIHAMPWARVEHIGSSAILESVSKGDLDIYVEVDGPRFDASITALQALGFTIKEGSFRSDELCPFESSTYPIDVGIQLVASGSKFEFFLTFRDAMNQSPNLRAEYNELKRRATGLAPAEYRRIKSTFIERVLAPPR